METGYRWPCVIAEGIGERCLLLLNPGCMEEEEEKCMRPCIQVQRKGEGQGDMVGGCMPRTYFAADSFRHINKVSNRVPAAMRTLLLSAIVEPKQPSL